MPKNVLIPLPSTDFDPTECAIPWRLLKQAGIQVTFATPNGEIADCDQRMLRGHRLGILAPVLAADKNAVQAYEELLLSEEFKKPIKWQMIQSDNFDGLILPGGHAPGMKLYLESTHLQKVVCEFFEANKPVGAICHGVVLASRSKMANGKSVLHGRTTTALLATQEYMAWAMTSLWLGSYYRTYEQSVQSEVKASLQSPKDFLQGPPPLFRDDPEHLDRGFTVLDGNYLSARWPGDAHKFSTEFIKLLR